MTNANSHKYRKPFQYYITIYEKKSQAKHFVIFFLTGFLLNLFHLKILIIFGIYTLILYQHYHLIIYNYTELTPKLSATASVAQW